ncbi:MAG: hypothetical protein IID41_11745 [Planctomycetes bacterium]|nr:hypothetical protein [Planctomycetota bacterium]
MAVALLGLTVFVARGGWREPASNDASLSITSSMFREDETGDAIQIMLVGDSIARSLSVGLYGEQEDEGFVLRDISVDNCGVMPGNVSHRGTNLGARCNAVRERWQPYVDLLNPDVVVLQISHWDGLNRTIGERQVAAGSSSWEISFRAALQDAVAVFSSRGASVVLLTAPYIAPSSVEPAIIDRLNDGARFVADANDINVSLVDLDHLLEQEGGYREELRGVVLRSNDGVHFTLDGSELVGGWLAPQLIELAADAATNGDEGPTDGLSSLINTDTSDDGAWQGWRSALSPVDDGILVSSTDAAYSAYIRTNASDLPLVQGETYVAIAWVRSDTQTTDGEIEIGVREDGAREGESIQIYRMTSYWQPILVEHTITKADLQSLELLILRLGTDAKPDAFIFRDVELHLASD